MKQIDECHQVLADPYGYAAKLKARTGRKIVGTFCSYAPEEFVIAAGAHPFRIFGTGEKARLAESHLQSYCCSLVRGALEDALAGRLGFLDGVVFPHTCDTIQRLSDIWRLNVAGCFHLDAVLPVRLDTENSRQYLREVLGRLRRELGEKLGAPIADADLRTALTLTNRIRKALTQVAALAGERPGSLKGADFSALARGAMIMDRSRAAALLEEVPAEMNATPPGPGAPDRKRVILSGGVCNQPEVYALIEEAGGAVVGDDLCTGARAYEGLIDAAGDPLAAISGRYLERVVCPAKHRGLAERADNLVRLARKKQAQGVIFFFLKFCDPHAFDYPHLRDALEKAGIRSMAIEVEDRLPGDGQLRTRFEAFIEMI